MACGDEIETVVHYSRNSKNCNLNRQKMLTNTFRLDPSLTLENKPVIYLANEFIISGSNCSDTNQLSIINNDILGT